MKYFESFSLTPVPLKYAWLPVMALLNHFHGWVSKTFSQSENAAGKVKIAAMVDHVIFSGGCCQISI